MQISSAHAWEPVGCGPDPTSKMATAAILDLLVYHTLQTPRPINPKLVMYSMGTWVEFQIYCYIFSLYCYIYSHIPMLLILWVESYYKYQPYVDKLGHM